MRFNFPSRQHVIQLVFQLSWNEAALLTEFLPVIAYLYILALCGDGSDIGDMTESEDQQELVYLFICRINSADFSGKVLRCERIVPNFIVRQWNSNLSAICGVFSPPVMEPGYVFEQSRQMCPAVLNMLNCAKFNFSSVGLYFYICLCNNNNNDNNNNSNNHNYNNNLIYIAPLKTYIYKVPHNNNKTVMQNIPTYIHVYV